MLFKRRKKTDDTQLHIESIPDESTKGFNVVEICEQMVDAARELEDNRTEYALVTNYLTDIERMENMSETDKKTMNDAAANILTLEKTRSDFLKTKNRISDSQYAQMQQLEDEIPRAIKRLEKNESSLDVINKDLRYLEGEKVQFDIDGEYAKSRQRAFRVYAVLLVVFFAVVVAVCTLMQIVSGADTTIFMLIGALLSAVAGSFVLLTYQSYSDEVKSAAASKNKAVALENRVKIKYVSIKNAVDYTYEKYHVKNSKEFVYNYEQYLLAVKDKERFRRTNEDLEYNSKKLVSVLSKNDFYDARVWLNYTNAIVDHKEIIYMILAVICHMVYAIIRLLIILFPHRHIIFIHKPFNNGIRFFRDLQRTAVFNSIILDTGIDQLRRIIRQCQITICLNDQ